jgi:hypothetical protein
MHQTKESFTGAMVNYDVTSMVPYPGKFSGAGQDTCRGQVKKKKETFHLYRRLLNVQGYYMHIKVNLWTGNCGTARDEKDQLSMKT